MSATTFDLGSVRFSETRPFYFHVHIGTSRFLNEDESRSIRTAIHSAIDHLVSQPFAVTITQAGTNGNPYSIHILDSHVGCWDEDSAVYDAIHATAARLLNYCENCGTPTGFPGHYCPECDALGTCQECGCPAGDHTQDCLAIN